MTNATVNSPIDTWHALLRPDGELKASYFEHLSATMRAARLTFGDRVQCPFLRPLFLTESDEARIRAFAETVAVLGERVVAAALATPSLLDELGLRPDEKRLVAIEPGYTRASTASRLDAFLLPDLLQATEYNAESPAGFGYSERLADVFESLPVMARFRERFDVQAYSMTSKMLDALLARSGRGAARRSPWSPSWPGARARRDGIRILQGDSSRSACRRWCCAAGSGVRRPPVAG